MSLTNGSGRIEPQNAMATISGQGLGVQERWDGRITVDQEIGKIGLSGLPTNKLHDKISVKFIAPKRQGLTDSIVQIPLTGLMVKGMTSDVSFFVPIIQDVIEVADKNKMEYARAYVVDDTEFRLNREYALIGGEYLTVDRGRAIQLTIDTEPFTELNELEILPFENQYFVNKSKVLADKFWLTEKVKITEKQAVLVLNYQTRVVGEVSKLEKGTMASFDLGFSVFEEILDLEEIRNG